MTKSLQRVSIFIISGLLLMSMSGFAIAQAEQTTAEQPPIAQPLVREGDFAVKLADALKLGTVTSETEAENLLGSAGIEPRNGWIADYPVTPDIMGELQTSVTNAANAGKLTMGKDEALKATQDVTSGFGLSIRTDGSTPAGQVGTVASGMNSPETPVINNYYYDEGPPVVTYYAPPPDYGYMYSYVPYPFWWWNFWYPGFYVLVDFHVGVHGHGGHGGFVSNHFRGPTGGVVRIDPANRSRGGTISGSGSPGMSRPAVRSGAQSILNSSQARARTGTSSGYRGYGNRPSTGTRSSVYEHSRNIRIERAASDRGYVNRSNAGRIPDGGRGGQAVSPGIPRGNSGGSALGTGGGSRGGGGGVSRGTGGGSRGSSGGSRGSGGGGYNGAGRR